MKAANSLPLLLLSNRAWNDNLAKRLSDALSRPVYLFKHPQELQEKAIRSLNPEWIFVPHWSYIIPENIWSAWPTVIFHMTDLPYGRGGSPLQNLIQRGFSSTKISALRCIADLDAGPVYCQEPLSLDGSAEEIFMRADILIEQMIKKIVLEKPEAIPQQGEPVFFSRRKPSQSNLANCPSGDLDAWFDQIRMLDADGYPHAFLEIQGIRLEFRRVSRRCDGLYADVRIVDIDQSSSG